MNDHDDIPNWVLWALAGIIAMLFMAIAYGY